MYAIKRTPEEGHTPACWTNAIKCALENERDALRETLRTPDGGSHEFRMWLQENGPLHTAEEYLKDGMVECRCMPLSLNRCRNTEHAYIPCDASGPYCWPKD